MPRYDSFLSLQSTPWFQAQFDLTLAALGKNVKKQQEVSDLNQDYICRRWAKWHDDKYCLQTTVYNDQIMTNICR